MVLHIGSGVLLFTRHIIAVFDSKMFAANKNNRQMLAAFREQGRVIGDEGHARSFVFAEAASQCVIYCSPICVKTLTQRNKSQRQAGRVYV